MRPSATSREAALRSTERLEDRTLLTLELTWTGLGGTLGVQENNAAVAADQVFISQNGNSIEVRLLSGARFDANNSTAEGNGLDYRFNNINVAAPGQANRAVISGLGLQSNGNLGIANLIVRTRGLADTLTIVNSDTDPLMIGDTILDLGTENDILTFGNAWNLLAVNFNQPAQTSDLDILNVEDTTQSFGPGVRVSGFTTIDNAGSVDLGDGDNDFRGGLFVNAGMNPVDINDRNDLTVSDIIAGSLTITAPDGIDQTMLSSVTSTLMTTLTAANAGADINLPNFGNDFNQLTANAGGSVTVADNQNIEIFGSNSSGDGSFTVIASAINVTGSVGVTGGDLVLDASQGRGDIIDSRSGRVTVNGTGSSMFMLSRDLLGVPQDSIDFGRDGDPARHDFHGDPDMVTTPSLSIDYAADVQLRDTGDLNFQLLDGRGNLTVTASSGTITDSDTISVTGTTALRAGGDITLDTPTNDFNIVTIASGADVVLVDSLNLTVGNITNSGSMDARTTRRLTVDGVINSGADVVLTSDESVMDTFDDDLVFDVGSGINSPTGGVTLNVADDLSMDATASLTGSSLLIELDNVANDNDVTVGSTAVLLGAFNVQGGIQVNGGADGDTIDASRITGVGVSIDGRDGNDVLTGTEEGEIIIGGLGNDLVNGERGNDTLRGGMGDDTVRTGAGNDDVDGGEGADVIDIFYRGGDVTVLGGVGPDAITVSDSGAGLLGSVTISGDDGTGVIDDADSFFISPLRGAAISIDGENPSGGATGDMLLLDLTEPTLGTITIPGGTINNLPTPDGSVSFSGPFEPITYMDIEEALGNDDRTPHYNANGRVIEPPAIDDVNPAFLGVSDTAPDTFQYQQVGGTIEVTVNGMLEDRLPLNSLDKLFFHGSADDDQLTGQQTGGGGQPGVDAEFRGSGVGDSDIVRIASQTGTESLIYRPSTAGMGSGDFFFEDGAFLRVSDVEDLQAGDIVNDPMAGPIARPFTSFILRPSFSQNDVTIDNGRDFDDTDNTVDLIAAGETLRLLGTTDVTLDLGIADASLPSDSVTILNNALRDATSLTNLTINTGQGTDTVEIQDGQFDLAGGGTFTIDAGPSTDVLIVKAQNDLLTPTLADPGEENVAFTISGTQIQAQTATQVTTIDLVNLVGERAELTGNVDDNSFNLRAWDQLATAVIDGGGGVDTLTALDNSAVTNIWNLTGVDEGDVGGFSFESVESLIGGDSASDRYIFATTARISGLVLAQGGTDTLDYSAFTDQLTFTLFTATASGFQGLAEAIDNGFSGIDEILGGANSQDELRGEDGATKAPTWEIDGSNRYIRGDLFPPRTLAFSGIEKLFGGDARDRFEITGTQAVAIDGGAGNDALVFQTGASLLIGGFDGGTGNDSLDYRNFGTSRAVTLTQSGGEGFNGTEAAITEGFFGVDTIVGSLAADDVLTGFGTVAIWTIDGNSAGSYADTVTAESLQFGLPAGVDPNGLSGFENIVGGNQSDTFNFTNGGTIGGNLTGAGDNDTIIGDGTRLRMDFVVDAPDSGTITSAGVSIVGGRFQSVETLIGGNGEDNFSFSNTGTLSGPIDGGGGLDRLIGDDDGNDFQVTAKDRGETNGKANTLGNAADDFSNIETLQGGAGPDRFRVGTAPPLVSAGPVILVGDLIGESGNDIFEFYDDGTILGAVIGGTGTDLLIGDSGDNIFDITGDTSGFTPISAVGRGQLATKTSLFTSIENIDGGDGDDRFNFTSLGSVTGIINGQGGNNLLSGDENGNQFSVTDTNQGRLFGKMNQFVSIQNLEGGDAVDTFAINARIDGNLKGFVGADIVLVGGSGTVGGNIDGDESDDRFEISGTVVGNISGGLANDIFVLNDGAQLDGIVNGDQDNDSFTITGDVTLANNLLGDTGDDVFAFGNNGHANLAVDGGAGTDTLEGDDDNNVFMVTGANSGSLDEKLDNGFLNIENLIGGDGLDTITVATGGTLAGSISGGANNDEITVTTDRYVAGTISGDDGDDVITLQSGALVGPSASPGAGGGTVLGGTGNDILNLDFDGIRNRILQFDAGDGNDDLVLTGDPVGATNPTAVYSLGQDDGSGTYATSVDIAAVTRTQTVTFSGLNSQILDSQNIANLTINATPEPDAVAFNDAAVMGDPDPFTELTVSSDIVVNNQPQTRTYAAFRFKGKDAVTLNAQGMSDTINLNHANAAAGLPDIHVNGEGGDDIVNILVDHKGNLTGGDGDDDFVFTNGMQLDGNLSGEAGTDTIDAQAYTTTLSVRLIPGAAPSGHTGTEASLFLAASEFDSIDTIIGGLAGNDELHGRDGADATWEVGNINNNGINIHRTTEDLTFMNFEVLEGGNQQDDFEVIGLQGVTVGGGAGNDQLQLADQAAIIGSFDGGAGTDTIAFPAYNTDQTVILTGDAADGYTGTTSLVRGDFEDVDVVRASTQAGATDTLVGLDAQSTWTFGAPFTYRFSTSVGMLEFSDFNNVQGGSATDTFDLLVDQPANLFGGAADDNFIFADGIVPDTGFDLSGESHTNKDTVDFSAHSTAGQFEVGGFVDIEDIIGGSIDDDTLVAGSGNDIVNVTQANMGAVQLAHVRSGSSTIVDFSSFENFWTGDGDDTVMFGVDGQLGVIASALGGELRGGAGSDTLDVSMKSGVTNITLTAAGTTDGFDGMDDLQTALVAGFRDIDQLIGGGNALTGDDQDATWTLGAAESYQVAPNVLSFSGFGTLNGGNAADTFNVNESLARTLNGGAGTDTIDVASGVNLTGDVNGGDDSDRFVLATGSMILGTVDGGTTGPADTVDYSASSVAAVITLQNTGLDHGFDGTATGIMNGFDNIDGVTGSSSSNGDILTGLDVAALWELNDPTTYAYTASGNQLNVANIDNLIGGSVVDTFEISAAATANLFGDDGSDTFTFTDNAGRLTGSIDGGTDDGVTDDLISFNGFSTTAAEATLVTSTPDGFSGTAGLLITGGFADIGNLIGGTGTADTLTGQDEVSRWLIDTTSVYTDDLTSRELDFSAFENLNGGSVGDTFAVLGNLPGTIDANAGEDVIDIFPGGTVGQDALGGTGNDILSLRDGGNLVGTFDAGSGTDSIQIDYTGGVARTFAVDGGSGTDVLTFTGGMPGPANVTVTYEAFDRVFTTDVDGTQQVVTISGIEPGDSERITSQQSADTLIVEASEAGDTIGVNDVASTFLTEVEFGGAFAPIEFLDTARLVVRGLGNDDSIVLDTPNSLNNPVPGFSLVVATVEAGPGNDTIDVRANHAGDLIGGDGDDLFLFADGTSVSGETANPIRGEDGIDTLDLSASSTGLTVSLTASDPFEGFSGTESSIILAGGQFSGLNAIIATSSGDSISGLPVNATWEIDGTDSYKVEPTGPTLAITGFDSLTGGTANDTFEITGNQAVDLRGFDGDDTFAFLDDAASVTGAIQGELGIDTLDFSGVSTGIDVTLLTTGGIGPDNGFDGTVSQVTGGFLDVNAVIGGSGANDTFTGINALSDWTINAATSTYEVLPNTLDFSLFENIGGGNTTDTFTISGTPTVNLLGGDGDDRFLFNNGADLNGTIDGGDQTIEDIVDYSNYLMGKEVELGSLFDIETLIDTGFDDTITGTGGADTFVINGVDSGLANGIGFVDWENLNGEDGTDSFAFDSDTSIVTGSIDGGADQDTLSGSGTSIGISYALMSAGSTDGFDGGAGGFVANFANINVLEGGSGSDSLTGLDLESFWTVGASSNYVTDVAMFGAPADFRTVDFSTIENLFGRSLVDTFNVAGSVTATIDSAAGDDVISLAGSTALTGNIIGGPDDDRFLFGSGATLIGSLDGVDGSDHLDFSTSATSVDVILQQVNPGNGGFDGDLTSISGGFDSIEALTGGNAADSVTGIDVASTWAIGASNSYTDTGNAETVSLSLFDDYIGGSDVDTFNVSAPVTADLDGAGGDDQFTFADGATVTGSVSGGVGDDDFDFFGITTLPTVLLDGGSHVTGDTVDFSFSLSAVTVSLDTFTDIETVVGTTLNDNILGTSGDDTFAIAGGNNNGSVGTLNFISFENLNGGAGDDTFDFDNGLGVSGLLDGGTGSDTVAYEDYTSPVAVNIGLGLSTNVGGGIANVENATGGTGNDSLIGDSGDNSLVGGDGNDELTDGAGDDTLEGGTGDDIYFLTPGSVDLITDDATSGNSDRLDFSNASAGITINLDSAAVQTVDGTNMIQLSGVFEEFVGSGHDDSVTASESITRDINGGDGSDTYASSDVGPNTWNISELNGGTLDSVTFSSFENLTGGTDADTFDFGPFGQITGNIDGNASPVDTLDFADLANGTTVAIDNLMNIEILVGSPQTDTITAAAAGSSFLITTVTSQVDGINFTSFEQLNGGDGADSFTFASGATLPSASINGGGGAGDNTLSLSGDDDDVVLSGLSSDLGFDGAVTGVVTFANINVLDTAGGTDSLTGRNSVAAWEIDGTNRYDSGGNSMSFAGVEDLFGGISADSFSISGAQTVDISGGDGADIFTLIDAAVLTGDIDGGVGTDRLSFSGSTAQDVQLNAAGGTDGYDGTTAGTISNFRNVDSLIGSNGSDTLRSPAAEAATWQLAVGGNIFTGPSASISFSQFDNLVGGGLDDTFEVTGSHSVSVDAGAGDDEIVYLANGAQITGSLDGGSHTVADTLDYSRVSSPITLSLDSLNGFENLIGGSGSDTLNGDAGNNNFNITTPNRGTVDGVSFDGFENLNGVGGADSFVFGIAGSVTSINGGADSDSLDVSATLTSRDVVLVSSDADGFSGTEAVAGNFAGINDVIGTVSDDSLTGLDGDAVWTLASAGTSYQTGGRTLTFSSFETLNGGANDDAFNLDDTLNLMLAGGVGNDSLTIADGQRLNGSFSGDSGTDTLDLSAFTGATSATVVGLGDGFAIDVAAADSTTDIDALRLGSSGSDMVSGRDAEATWTLGATDVYSSGSRTMTISGAEQRRGGAGNDTYNVQVDALLGGDNHVLTGRDGGDVFNLNYTAGAALNATATLAINGQDPVADPSNPDVVTINVNQTADGARNIGINWRDALNGSVDVTGLGGVTQLNTIESLNVNGDAANDDSITVEGTASDDDITVAPSANGALLYIGGTSDFITPGVAGGSNGPDIALSGLASTAGLLVDGDFGTDQLLYDGNGMINVVTGSSGTILTPGLIDVAYQNFEDLGVAQPIGFTLNAQTESGDTTADDFTVVLNGGTVEIRANSNLLFSEDLSDIDSLTIDGSNDDDSLTVDLTSGNPLPAGGLTFNGFGETAGDDLTVLGGGGESATYTPDTAIDGNGVISIDATTITFTGLEPVTVSNMADLTFVSPNGADVITVDSPALDQNRISGTSSGTGFEELTFFDIADVTIDAATNGSASDSDTVTFASDLVASGLVSVSVTTGQGSDTVDASNVTAIGLVIDGGDGNDTITGGGGDDVLTAGAGTDQIVQQADGTQVLSDTGLSGRGNDTISSFEDALITGGAGADIVDASGFSGHTFVQLLGGADQFFGGTGVDEVIGGGGKDTLDGGAGGDRLLGGGDRDRLIGGVGDDTLIGQGSIDNLIGGPGDDLLNGGSGSDVAEEVANNGFTLTNKSLTGQGNDLLINIEKAFLTSGDGDDVFDLTGFTGLFTSILANGGDDTVHGSETADNIVGFSGNDQLFGNGGNDTLAGSAGRDLLVGGDGNDWLKGQGGGRDTLTGGSGDDRLDGGAGSDIVDETGDVDFTLTDSTLEGLGSDTLINVEIVSLTGGTGANTIDASGTGLQTDLNGGFGDDTITGGSGVDIIDGGADNDEINGGAGDDTIDGAEGDDVLSGGDGSNDMVLVTANADLTVSNTQTTGDGTDSISEFEDARLEGGSGPNRLDASAGSLRTFLIGNDGNDTLLGGDGNDVLNGGAGIDATELTGAEIVLSDSGFSGGGTDQVIDVEGVLLRALTTASRLDASGYTGGSVTLIGGAGNDTLRGGSGNDDLTGNGGNDQIDGGAGDDIASGNDGSDTVDGGAGNDNINGNAGNDVVRGGADNDTAAGGSGADSVEGGTGNDILRGNSGTDTLRGGDGNDLLEGGNDNDTLYGEANDDTLLGGEAEDGLNGGTGNDQLVGEAGNDTLLGLSGNDALIGGASDDTLIGGDGDDTLRGNGGNDKAAGNAGRNTFFVSNREIDETFSDASFPALL